MKLRRELDKLCDRREGCAEKWLYTVWRGGNTLIKRRVIQRS
jgi:hypothetical protein